MRALLLNQFFPPDAAPTGELLADVAEELAARGWDVTVVCGRSRYAGDGGRAVNGVRVLRAPALPFARGKAARVMSYASYMAAALWRGLREPQPDLVLSMTTPPLLSVIGDLLKRRRGCAHVIWEMDLYPDLATALGVLRPHGKPARALAGLAGGARRRADAILVLGECMKERLRGQGIAESKLHIADNWADGECIRPQPRAVNAGALHVLYSGNLGMAHDTETICRAMEAMKHDRRVRFTFAGGGARRGEVEEFCRRRGLSHVSFQPYRPKAQLGAALGAADIGLVTQLPASLGCLVPGKIYGIMAAERPILFIGPKQAHAARLIARHGCGWQVDCGDWQSAVALLDHLACSPGEIEEAGARARKAFLEHYDRPAGVDRVVDCLLAASSSSVPETEAVSQVHS